MSKIQPTNLSVLVIGAGPAGLTAALELQRAGVRDITIIEASDEIGGISRTVNYKGNRIDIGGHRFFSKSDWVMKWWSQLLPLAESEHGNSGRVFAYRGQQREELPSSVSRDASNEDVLLVRDRLSRIYYNSRFFDYPLKLNLETLRNLGFYKTVTFGVSFFLSKLFPRRPESSLEDFFVNRFGNRLYRQFFKEYTEKVWGVPCAQISADWGAQRIKSLSILSALTHALKSSLGLGKRAAQQTSLIESFLYPKYGPGQMWETAARVFTENGGTLIKNCRAIEFDLRGERLAGVRAQGTLGREFRFESDFVISTMPIKDLVNGLPATWSPKSREIASGLQYRDFITVGLLYQESSLREALRDNWIYIQEPGVQVGRVQIFNNWSPFLVNSPGTIWLGLEFFCREGDHLWSLADDELKALAQREMHQIGLVKRAASVDAVVIRVPKAYPGYFGDAFLHFDELRQDLDRISNLFLVGRNGMHRYNNQDHSMLTAKRAVELILSGDSRKEDIWAINIDDEYHEEAK